MTMSDTFIKVTRATISLDVDDVIVDVDGVQYIIDDIERVNGTVFFSHFETRKKGVSPPVNAEVFFSSTGEESYNIPFSEFSRGSRYKKVVR